MISKSNDNRKKKIIFYTFLIILSSLLIWKISPIKKEKRELAEFTTFAESGSLPGTITASGELQSKQSVNVSPKRQGILEEIFVGAGDKVQKGQLIAQMNQGDLKYRIDEIKAEVKKQKDNYNRRKFLYNEGAISKEKYDEFKTLLLQSEAKLKQIEIEEKELKILAPFKGIITSKFSVPGSFVTPTTAASSSPNGGSTNSSIVELSQGLQIIAKVPESDIGRIQIGQEANIRVDPFPEKRFKAKVNEISPRAIKNNNVTSFEVTLFFIKPPETLRIGMTADIEFNTGLTSIRTLVPTVAIVTKKGIPGLLFVGKENQPEFKSIELGNSSGSKTSIIKGINPGEQIFIDIPPWSKQIKD